MTNKYYSNKQPKKSLNDMEIHPIWRGIGFLLLVITPIISYFLSVFILDANRANGWIDIPRGMIAFGNSDPFIYIKIFLTIVFVVFIYGIYTFITFLLFSLFGPSRYGPYDVPNVAYKKRKR